MPQAVGLALFQLGASLGVVNFFTIGFGATLITTALTVGPALAVGLLTQRRPSAPNIKPSDGQQVIRQAVPPRWKHYGKVRVAGPMWWMDATTTGPNTLYLGLIINHGEIDSYVKYHIDGNTVTIDGSGNVEQTPYSTHTVNIATRLGVAQETEYSDITSAFNYPYMRGDGVATVLVKFPTPSGANAAEAFQEAYPNGVPTFRVTIKATKVWDPRDSAQDREDDSTWTWSENPALCLLDYLMSADGYGLPWSRFSGSIEDWKTAADQCEEQVFSAEDGGLIDRYRVALTYRFDEDPVDVVRRFESAMDGQMWQKRDGFISLSVGVNRTPAVTIEDDHILGHDLMRGQDQLQRVEGVRAQYMSPGNDYREQDATAWPNAATVAGLTSDRVMNLDLTSCPSHGQARRLMERAYIRARADWSGSVVTNLSGLRALDEREIRLKITELGIDEDFEVEHFSIDMSDLKVTLKVRSMPTITDPASTITLPENVRGVGYTTQTTSSVALSFENVIAGEKPQAGDSVVYVVTALGVSPTPPTVGGNPTNWDSPEMLSEVTGEHGMGAYSVESILQADIDTPPTPITASTQAVGHWIAIKSDAVVTAEYSHDEGADFSLTQPVNRGASGSTIGILGSTHSAQSDEPIEVVWMGEAYDFIFQHVAGGVAQTLAFKWVDQGFGDEVSVEDIYADMTNEDRLKIQHIWRHKVDTYDPGIDD